MLLILALAGASSAALQLPNPAEVLPPGPSRHSMVQFDMDAAGTHWARGRTYKASACDAGFAFIPFLGSDAPRNYPVKFRLTGVTRGGEALAMEDRARVTRTHERIALDRGLVQARYDFTTGGVEQSFAIAPQEGFGDLELTIAVETELSILPFEGGFRFSNELGGVIYGAATALDGTGQSIPLEATWSNESISLTVAESFLANAVGTIVIDPLISTFSVNQAPADLGAPDGAYSMSSLVYCFVAEERFSGSDVDIYSWLYSAPGGVSGGAYADQTSRSWESPAIAAWQNIDESFLVVAEADSVAVPGKRDIVQRERMLGSGFQSPSIQRSATSTYSCVDPDIGADNIPQGLGARTVYLRDYGSYHGLYTFQNFSALDTPLSSASTHDVSPPAISKQTGIDVRLMVAWSSREIATGFSSVHGRLLSLTQGPISGVITVAPPTTNAFFFDIDVSIVNAQGYYVISYDDRPSNVSDAFVALGRDAEIHDVIELQIAEHSDRAPNQDNVQLGTTVSGFWAGYVENGDLRLTSLRPVENRLCVARRRRLVVGANVTAGSLAVLQDMNGNPGQRALFMWSEAGATSEEIHANFTPSSTGGPVAGPNFCYGTANSTGDRGFIQAFGDRVPGTAHFLRVEALPPNVFGYYLSSMTTASTPLAGGSQGTLCVTGSTGRFGIFQSDAFGTSSHSLDTSQIPQPTGPVAALSGQTWAFQSWFRDSVGGAATSNFTNGATILFQ